MLSLCIEIYLLFWCLTVYLYFCIWNDDWFPFYHEFSFFNFHCLFVVNCLSVESWKGSDNDRLQLKLLLETMKSEFSMTWDSLNTQVTQMYLIERKQIEENIRDEINVCLNLYIYFLKIMIYFSLIVLNDYLGCSISLFRRRSWWILKSIRRISLILLQINWRRFVWIFHFAIYFHYYVLLAVLLKWFEYFLLLFFILVLFFIGVWY